MYSGENSQNTTLHLFSQFLHFLFSHHNFVCSSLFWFTATYHFIPVQVFRKINAVELLEDKCAFMLFPVLTFNTSQILYIITIQAFKDVQWRKSNKYIDMYLQYFSNILSVNCPIYTNRDGKFPAVKEELKSKLFEFWFRWFFFTIRINVIFMIKIIISSFIIMTFSKSSCSLNIIQGHTAITWTMDCQPHHPYLLHGHHIPHNDDPPD